jgi:hypothetical protein
MYHNGTMHNDACPAPPAFKVTHMPAQSLAEQLQNFSKSQLKHQQTSITYQSGKKIIVDGEKIIEEGASHTGYVVDTKPDQLCYKVLPGLFMGTDCTIAYSSWYTATHACAIQQVVRTA